MTSGAIAGWNYESVELWWPVTVSPLVLVETTLRCALTISGQSERL